MPVHKWPQLLGQEQLVEARVHALVLRPQTQSAVIDLGRVECSAVRMQTLPQNLCHAVVHFGLSQRRRILAGGGGPRRHVHWQRLVHGVSARQARQQLVRRDFPVCRSKHDLRRLHQQKLGHRLATCVLGRFILALS